MSILIATLIPMICLDEPPVQSELLPPAPEGWRFERLEFPLEFAPELKHTGFEELRFGPGMFDAESKTYWTYVFAMKITNEIKLDADQLTSILNLYYRGLCRAVAKSRSFTIDESKIVAEVRDAEPKKAGHYRATMQCYDAFVTGKPLTLHLDIVTVRLAEDDTRLFAAVSPRPMTDDVWKPMVAMKSAFLEALPKKTP